ncbi:hypothetical protein D3C76_1297070 [compost metagenome]
MGTVEQGKFNVPQPFEALWPPLEACVCQAQLPELLHTTKVRCTAQGVGTEVQMAQMDERGQFTAVGGRQYNAVTHQAQVVKAG